MFINNYKNLIRPLLLLTVGYGICETPADFENTQLKWSSPSTLTRNPPIPSTWTRNHARARTQMRESEPLASSSSYRRITTNRSLLWVTSFEYVHEGVTRGGGGVQYDRLIDVLTIQCHSVVLEIIGWSFSSSARSTDD